MRWKHPTMGEIPDAFINFAEAQQLIVLPTLHLFDLIIHDAPVLQTQLPPGANSVSTLLPGIYTPTALKMICAPLRELLLPDHFQLVLEITERHA